MALLVDSPRSRVSDGPPTPTNVIVVFDADGNEIMQIEGTTGGPLVTDLRIDTTQIPGAFVDQVGPPSTAAVTDVIHIDGTLVGRQVATDDALWITIEGGVVRVDLDARVVTNTIPISERIWSTMTAGTGAIWLGGEHSVTRLDVAAREITDTIRLSGPASPMVAGSLENGLWVFAEQLIRIDVATPRISARFDLPDSLRGQFASWTAVVDREIWGLFHGEFGDWILFRFDPASGESSSYEVPCCGFTEEGAVIADDAAWIIHHSGKVARFDLTTGEITDTLEFGVGLRRGVVADSAIWLPNVDQGTVTRVDPMLREVTDVIDINTDADHDPGPHFLFGWLGVASDAIWAANERASTVSRIDFGSRLLTDTVELGEVSDLSVSVTPLVTEDAEQGSGPPSG